MYEPADPFAVVGTNGLTPPGGVARKAGKAD
jgi:hypothetical protein